MVLQILLIGVLNAYGYQLIEIAERCKLALLMEDEHEKPAAATARSSNEDCWLNVDKKQGKYCYGQAPHCSNTVFKMYSLINPSASHPKPPIS